MKLASFAVVLISAAMFLAARIRQVDINDQSVVVETMNCDFAAGATELGKDVTLNCLKPFGDITNLEMQWGN